MSVIFVCGLPGAGKTTVAKELGKKMNAPVLSTDKIRKEIIAEPTYSPKEKLLVYDMMIVIAKYLHNAGLSCILDATFSQKKFRDEAKRKLGISEDNIHIVECTCPEDVTISRIKQRKDDYSDADVQIYYDMKKIYEPVQDRHVTIDTSHDMQSNIQDILKQIGE